MKFLKRSIAVLLAMIMIVSVLPVVGAAGNNLTVDVGSATLAKGTPVTIPVTFDNQTSRLIGVAKFEVVYDKENLTLTKISASNGAQSSVFPAAMFIDNVARGTLDAMIMDGVSDKTGTICWLTFEAKDNVVNGSYSISLVPYKVACILTDLDFAPFSDVLVANAGTITVTGGVDKLTETNTTITGLNAEYTYTGSAIEPNFTVKYGTKTLRKGTDYTVSFANNTNVGTATVTITGKGSYQGEFTKEFKIVKKDAAISGTASYEVVYNGSVTLDATLNHSETTLTYKSSDTSVATVDSTGKVTGKKAGDAFITVSAAETANYKAAEKQVAVTVKAAEQSLTTDKNTYNVTYGEDPFSLGLTGAQGTVTYTSTNTNVATVDSTGKVTIKAAGTANIQIAAAKVDGQYNAATKTVSVVVAKKPVTVSGIAAADKVYDGNTNAVVNKSQVAYDGLVAGDQLDVNVTGKFADKNAGENKTVNLTMELAGTDKGNYTLSGTSQKTATATIEQAEVAVPTAVTTLVYKAGTEQTGVAATADYTVTNGSATNAGDYTATAALKDATNYKWADPSFDGTVAWSIAKADLDALTMSKTVRYSTTANQTISISDIAALMGQPGNVTVSGSSVIAPGSILDHLTVGVDGITYALADGLTAADKDRSETIVVTVSSDNYNDTTLTVTVTVQDKLKADLQFESGSAFYTGKVQKHETATSTTGAASNITYAYSADPLNVGTYQVTATYEDENYYEQKTVDFEIKAVSIAVTGGQAETKEYDATTAAVMDSVSFTGLVNGETFSAADYNVTSAAFADANVGANKQVNFAVELADTAAAKNYVLTGTIPAGRGTITAKTVDIIVDSIGDVTFTGSALTPAVNVTCTDTLNGYTLTEGTDYTVSYENNVNVGTAKAVITAEAGSNYTFSQEEVEFQIIKAAAPAIADLAAEYTYNYSGARSLDIAGIPANAGAVTYMVGAPVGEASLISDTAAANGKVTFTVNAVDASLIGASVTVPVTIQMQNYNDVTIDVVITRIEKNMPAVTAQSIEKVYDGMELTNDVIRGTAMFGGTALAGTWSWVTAPATLVNANETGYTATVRFTPADIDEYAEVDTTITVVIKKATPTGQPSYTRISEDEKTLADANLEVGSITPAGTIAWVDADTTKVEAGKEYEWIFTPADSVNYDTITGKLVPYLNGEIIVRPFFDKTEPHHFVSVLDRFYDVNPTDWYGLAVHTMVTEGLFDGVSQNAFQPNGTMTRAMLVTVLWRLAGEPAATASCSFADVAPNAWYADAVAWAQSTGVVTGISETKFAPNMSITREQMAVILHRYTVSMGNAAGERADLSGYADCDQISAYAVDAMSWAVARTFISGMDAVTLAPTGTATRAQVATILMRYMNYMQ